MLTYTFNGQTDILEEVLPELDYKDKTSRIVESHLMKPTETIYHDVTITEYFIDQFYRIKKKEEGCEDPTYEFEIGEHVNYLVITTYPFNKGSFTEMTFTDKL